MNHMLVPGVITPLPLTGQVALSCTTVAWQGEGDLEDRLWRAVEGIYNWSLGYDDG